MRAPPVPASPATPGVVVFSPLPPKPNGIADYCHELLGPLSRRMPCTVVVEDGHPDAQAPEGVAVMSLLEYRAAAHGPLAEALHLYQLGNNPDHLYMLPIMAARPGVVVLHDPALHHLLDVATVGRSDFAGYTAALEAEYGTPGRLLGQQFRDWRLRHQRMYFDLPMLRGVLGGQRGVIVHSRFAASKVLAQMPDAALTVVPHQYSPPPAERIRPAQAVRAGLGVAADEMLFLSLGFVTRAKQIDAALRALASIRDRLPPFRYVIAGELRPEEIDIAGLAQVLGLSDRVIALGYVPEEAFFSLAAAADVVINLRHPVGGETSGTMIRALGAGACLVVVDRGAFAEIPDGAAVKLPWGPGFDDRLAAALLRLAGDPSLRRRTGAAARRAILAANTLERTVAGYVWAMDRARAASPRPWATRAVWEYLPDRDLAELIAMADPAASLPLWFRIGAVPAAAAALCQVLAMGADRDLLGRLGHASVVAVPLSLAMDDGMPARGVDLIVLAIDLAELPDPAAALLVAVNRLLGFGGLLVINLTRQPDRSGRHALEDRASGERLLEACGFRVQIATAAAPPSLQADHPVAAGTMVEERCWRAVKISEFVAAEVRETLSAPAARAAPLQSAVA